MNSDSFHFKRFQKETKDMVSDWMSRHSPIIRKPLFDDDMIGLELPDPHDYGPEQIDAFLRSIDSKANLDERQEAHVAQTVAATETFRNLKTEQQFIEKAFDLAQQMYNEKMTKDVRRYMDKFLAMRREILSEKYNELIGLIQSQVDLLPKDLTENFTIEAEAINQAIPIVDFEMVAKWGDADWKRKELIA